MLPHDDDALTRLRTELSTLENLDWPTQRTMVRSMRAIYPHSIRPIPFDPHLHDRIRYFNCIAFAFKLTQWPEFFNYTIGNDIKFDPKLIAAMVADLSKKQIADVIDDDLAIYSTDTEIVHAGIVSGNCVRSKWATDFAWEHGTFEVPSGYGQKVHYFSPSTIELTVSRFKRYAQRQLEYREERIEELEHRNDLPIPPAARGTPSRGSR